MRLRVLILLLPQLLPSPAQGAPATALPGYFSHTWETEDGLPQNAVSAITQTRDGYLWLGTYNGLARFDGVRFVVFNAGNTPKMRSSRVTSLYEDPGGTLWIGHESGELTRMTGGNFESVETSSSSNAGKILGIGTDGAGDVWFMSQRGLLGRLKDALVLSPPSGGASGSLGFARNSAGAIWVLREGQVSVLQNNSLVALNFDAPTAGGYVQGVCASRDRGFWVIRDGRVRKWRGGDWIIDWGPAPWGVAPTTAFMESQGGILAAGTSEQGLFLMFPKGGTLHFSRTNGLPHDWVRCLSEDREGNLWVGAGSGGLTALRAGKVATLDSPDHWQGRAILSVTAARDGAMWVATEGAGVYRFHENQWTHFGESAGVSNRFVWSLAEDAQGRMWAGSWGGGLFVQDRDRFAPAPGLETVMAPMPALLHAADGELWIGTGDGLLRYERGQASWFGRDEVLEKPDVRAVLKDRQGVVWFGMLGGGLGQLKNGSVRQFRKSDGLASDYVQALQLDAAGTLWIGTFGSGLCRLKQGRFANVNETHGLANNVICHIADDGQGYFWISSFGGIMRVSQAELNQCADGTLNKLRCLTYGTGDGMPTLECSGGSQPAGCRSPDGRLWFATTKGLVMVSPEEIKTNQLPPPVVIEEMRVDNRRINLSSEDTAPTIIPPGRHRFEFDYTGLSFVAPLKVRFQHRLEGYDSEWFDAGANRSANYGYVPPGHYTFRVIACNNDGLWNEQGAMLEFTVLPFFWQTLWFRALAGIGIVALASGAVWFDTRRRMRRKLERLERQRAIERERTRIAKDIHDDLGASLTRITLLSQTARADLQDPAQAASDLDRIYGTARELTRAMDEIVWAVNPQHDTLDSLASYLGKFAQDYVGAAGLRCRLDVPMQLPAWPLTAEVRHNLFLAFKEALHNVVKHAAASEVRISLAPETDAFTLIVEDNGRGFAANAPAGHSQPASDRFAHGNGLANMQRRLAEIGGRCEIQSVSGQGTKLTFFAKVATRSTQP